MPYGPLERPRSMLRDRGVRFCLRPKQIEPLMSVMIRYSTFRRDGNRASGQRR